MAKNQGKTLVGRLDKPVFILGFGIIYENQIRITKFDLLKAPAPNFF